MCLLLRRCLACINVEQGHGVALGMRRRELSIASHGGHSPALCLAFAHGLIGIIYNMSLMLLTTRIN